ncbi:rRNA maturation RNase YbeY [Paludibacter sp.]|uniref:rRNA maturation RNase YbeY n=1 Tax=Paludibacter sp. TaxID=1898105 RepID=UPI0025F60E47|nr:rRNA maturation RNase YbeY [Paludibacter sp.]
MIHYYSENIPQPKLRKRLISAWIKEVAQLHGKTTGEISYIFCDDEKILEVNRQYLQHDYYTDIITFDDNEGDKINGDIFISLDTVADNAKEFDVTFENELHRVMIHGILHLCGQDDHSKEERAEMIRKENEALSLFSSKYALLNV